MKAYGVELEDDPEKRAEMKVERKNGREIKEILRDGLASWKRAGRVASRFLSADVRYWNDEVGAHQYRKVRAALGKR
jgi:hypothetical protein